MINLLPLQNKKQIKAEYKVRLLAIVLFFVALLGLILLIFSILLYTTLSSKESVVKNYLEILISDNEVNKISSDTLEDINRKIEILKKGEKKIFLNEDVLGLLLGDVGNVTVTSISYYSGGNMKNVDITGVSPDRDALLNFISILKKKGFSEIDVPVSNFVKDENLEFSLKITL